MRLDYSLGWSPAPAWRPPDGGPGIHPAFDMAAAQTVVDQRRTLPGRTLTVPDSFKNCIAFKRRKVFQYPRREMKITRLLGIALIAIAVASGASSCCSVKRYLAFHEIGPEAITQPEASSVRMTLILRNITTSGFIEWKAASDQMCTQSSGRIGPDTEAFEQTWDMGTPEQHIWFWWDTLNGDADATVLVNDVVVFEGRCAHVGRGNVPMISTCSYPRVYKTSGTGPYLIEPMGLNETYVVFASSKLPP